MFTFGINLLKYSRTIKFNITLNIQGIICVNYEIQLLILSPYMANNSAYIGSDQSTNKYIESYCITWSSWNSIDSLLQQKKIMASGFWIKMQTSFAALCYTHISYIWHTMVWCETTLEIESNRIFIFQYLE